jgi:phosphoserine phosphatase
VTALPSSPFRTVLFDCDSTLSAIEGIDELAGALRPEIERLTDAAMRGEVSLESIYGARLALIKPSRKQVNDLAVRYVLEMVPDARETVVALLAEGIAVRIVSGGIRQAIIPLAQALGLTAADVGAVRLKFSSDGTYSGFDEASPLTRSAGKLEIVQRWRSELPAPIMFVGDGMTDLEARPAVDSFVAFAGVVDRPAVTSRADVIVRARSLSPILPIALGGRRPASDPARATFDRGLELLSSCHPSPSNLNPIPR